MSVSWAYLYKHHGTDPAVDRLMVDRSGLRTLLVPVPDPRHAGPVAAALVDEGVELIELCGAFTLAEAAAVTEAVGGRVPVGHVSFGADSVSGAAAFGARADAAAPAGTT